ncbi:MAG: C-GCAxxG-C-C family protein [Muribaculaceae bacterium]|nr:C-GCAxxG-C-C family protein [Muribaculaceae bacterium]
MKKTLEERKTEALRLRHEGYNCSQSVIMAFDDITGLEAETAARLTSGLGTGVGGSGEICGVINAMALTQGMLQSAGPSGKAASAREVRKLLDEFAESNRGRVRCADLKGKEGIRPCADLVLQGVEILHRYFESKGL